MAVQPAATAAPPDVPVGQVFMVNPVQSSGDETLVDAKDADSAVPASAYASVPLRNLDGSGKLSGKYVVVRSSTGKPADVSSGFVYTRHADQFEQVMAYFWVNEAQEYIQSLGFGSDLRSVHADQQAVRVGQWGADNSFFTDQHAEIRYGKGGVDDAEDAEVIVHEYGHSVHASQVPGFGTSEEAGSIGEAFGDYLAVSVGLAADARYGWPIHTSPACVADWDSVSYTAGPVHCLRTVDGDKTYADKVGEVHADGEIWSRALWDIRTALGDRTANRIIINAQFRFAPDTSFHDAALATIDTAQQMYGSAEANAVRAAFQAREIPGI
ncbi:MAG TPA: M4 family metallopeptidase [Nocardioides sp.]|uniref:M4 family metallopeptidase n=1 Tax=Nocardioides sp. TaxID=35761 RepID=UPI002E2EE2E7|nr:M4 family metallopeptidase [Nocardioides sp.]HEX5088092.1 M4 family metallopeptidase [Nocardioides sp.]